MGKLAKKKYIDSDVYTEAKKRIRNIINMFDSVLVCFSGGKDSLTTLCLVEEVYKEMGIKEKVKVVFRDEELIPDDVINFVISKYKSGIYDFRYYAIPLKSSKFILGKTYDYIQWDKDREWVRQPPKFAIKMDNYQVFDQYTADSYICKNEKGKVAMLTGMRADESLIRFSSCVSKVDNNYINNTQDKRIKLCKPIYDWTERDIFLYFYKNNIKYCKIYDLQLLNRQNFRVSTPLHAESSKQFDKLKTLYPVFYQQIINIFPEMLVQERYWKELNRDISDLDKYPHSIAGIKQYIEEHITDAHQKKLALLRVSKCMTNRANKIKEGRISNLGGYPIRYLFKAIINGQYKRNIMPKNTANQEYLDILDKDLAHIQITTTCLDDELYKKLNYEKACLPSRRIQAIKKLQDNDFDVSIRLSPLIEEFIDFDKLNDLGINKAVIEFLRVNHWIKKWFDIDYSKYTLKENGYNHLPLDEKIRILEKVKIENISICEDVTEHYNYWKENINPNKLDCCNLRMIYK